MKIFVKFFAGSALAMDCGVLNTGQACNSGQTIPKCDMGNICFKNTDNCFNSCQPEENCHGTNKIWSYSPDTENKISYCAETPNKPSYSCGYTGAGSPVVRASFGPIKTAYKSWDKREYEFYPKTFDAEDYKYGMFDTDAGF